MIRPMPRSTKMDRQGRVFLSQTFRRRMGLLAGGEVEFYMTEDGQWAMRKAPEPKKKMPK